MSQIGTLTIPVPLDPKIPLSFPTDHGTAIPAANTLNVLASGGTSTHPGQNINTAGAGNTVTPSLNNTYQVVTGQPFEIGTVDSNEILGSISVAALKQLLGIP